MTAKRPIRIALAWAQLSPEHGDRAAATAARLDGRASVTAIAMASTTLAYADAAPAATAEGFRTVTIFPGQRFEDVPVWRRCLALFRETRRADLICMGIGYNNADALVASWLLRLTGRRVVMLNDTKFEDRPRSALGELGKRIALSCYHAAIVAGARSFEYFRFLGFRRRPMFPGCDTISLDRIRSDAGPAVPVPFEARSFVFVGRFVDVKNLDLLVDGYARYAAAAGTAAHRLVLIGSGPLAEDLRARIEGSKIARLVDLPGYRTGPELARLLSSALALILVSYSETWGLVVNEASALGIPTIISEASGARDTLVRNLVNGLVIESGSVEALAQAMAQITASEDRWLAMAAAARDRAWLGDAAVFADAIELLIDPASPQPGARLTRYLDEYRGYWGRSPF